MIKKEDFIITCIVHDAKDQVSNSEATNSNELPFELSSNVSETLTPVKGLENWRMCKFSTSSDSLASCASAMRRKLARSITARRDVHTSEGSALTSWHGLPLPFLPHPDTHLSAAELLSHSPRTLVTTENSAVHCMEPMTQEPMSSVKTRQPWAYCRTVLQLQVSKSKEGCGP